MICIVQVILEHLLFVSEPILVCAFESERVLVDGRVVGPSHSLSPRSDLGDGPRQRSEVTVALTHTVCVFLYLTYQTATVM